ARTNKRGAQGPSLLPTPTLMKRERPVDDDDHPATKKQRCDNEVGCGFLDILIPDTRGYLYQEHLTLISLLPLSLTCRALLEEARAEVKKERAQIEGDRDIYLHLLDGMRTQCYELVVCTWPEWAL